MSLLTGVAWGLSYSYRYWFDSDVAGAKTGTGSGEKQFDVDISSLAYGLHAIHLQAKNASGVWSSVYTRYFMVTKAQQASVSARYWIDNDVEHAHNGVATSGIIDLDITGLKNGIHSVHYQKMGADGTPSSVYTRFFMLAEKQQACVSARYWIDNDVAHAHNDVATSGLIELDIANLKNGIHCVHYEKMGADGTPSSVYTRYFYLDRKPTGSLTARISIDDGEATDYAYTGNDIIIDIGALSDGEHSLSVTLAYASGFVIGTKESTFLSENGYLLGDMNRNGEVNGTDLVLLVTAILEGSYDGIGDMNQNGELNGTDYVLLVNYILEMDASATRQDKPIEPASLYIKDFTIQAGETAELAVGLTNVGETETLTQFDLLLPEGLTVIEDADGLSIDMAERTTWRTHTLSTKAADGFTRVLLASSTNAAISGNSGTLVRIRIKADESFSGGDIMLRNQLIVTPEGSETKPATYLYSLGESNAIEGVFTSVPVDVYSLSGSRVRTAATTLQGLPKGVYIVNGKRVIIK